MNDVLLSAFSGIVSVTQMLSDYLWTTDKDGRSHTGKIARAHPAGQRHGKGLERAYLLDGIVCANNC